MVDIQMLLALLGCGNCVNMLRKRVPARSNGTAEPRQQKLTTPPKITGEDDGGRRSFIFIQDMCKPS